MAIHRIEPTIEAIDAAMGKWIYMVARYLNGEVVEIWAADSEVELDEKAMELRRLPGEVDVRQKSN